VHAMMQISFSITLIRYCMLRIE